MATFATLVARTQSILNDPTGFAFNETSLKEPLNAALDDVLEMLEDAGLVGTRYRTTRNLVALTNALTLSGYTTSAGGSGVSPALPSNIIEPDDMFEKTTGAADTAYTKVMGPTPLPVAAQTQQIRWWDWRTHQITMLGATEARTIRLDYYGTLTSFSLPTDTVELLGASNAICYFAAARVSGGRAQMELTSFLEAKGREAVQRIVNRGTRVTQNVTLRRAPRLGYMRYPTGV